MDDFEKDLFYLRDNGYTAITCSDLIAYSNGSGSLPEKPVLLTIDDGRYGVYSCAYPLLEKYGMCATFSVIGERIDTETIEDASDTREYLFCAWDEIKEMQSSGAIEVVSHTYGLHNDEADEINTGASAIGETGTEFEKSALNDDIKMSDTLMKRLGSFNKYELFLASRILFDQFNGSMIISGAFGLYKKNVVIAAGGYDNKTSRTHFTAENSS